MRRATLVASTAGRFIAYLFIIFGVWQILAGNLLNGMWIAFIGWFLESAARGQARQVALHDFLGGHKVSQAMSRHYESVPADATLQDLLEDHFLGSGRRSFVVRRGSEVIGLLTIHHLKGISPSAWPTVTAAQAMIPAKEMKRVRPDSELWSALEEMDRDGVNQLPVMTDGQIQGMLSREDVVDYLRTLRAAGTDLLEGR